MKIYLSILSIFISVFFIFPVISYSQNPTKDDSSISKKQIVDEYNLQERCANTCKEYFYKMFQRSGDTDKSFRLENYENHYNKKLNKCFILISIKYAEKITGQPEHGNFWLYSIHENKTYGAIFIGYREPEVGICNVMDIKCKSIDEWDSLIKPYMEE